VFDPDHEHIRVFYLKTLSRICALVSSMRCGQGMFTPLHQHIDYDDAKTVLKARVVLSRRAGTF